MDMTDYLQTQQEQFQKDFKEIKEAAWCGHHNLKLVKLIHHLASIAPEEFSRTSAGNYRISQAEEDEALIIKQRSGVVVIEVRLAGEMRAFASSAHGCELVDQTWKLLDDAYGRITERLQTWFHGCRSQNTGESVKAATHLDVVQENVRFSLPCEIEYKGGVIVTIYLIFWMWDMLHLNVDLRREVVLNSMRYRLKDPAAIPPERWGHDDAVYVLQAHAVGE